MNRRIDKVTLPGGYTQTPLAKTFLAVDHSSLSALKLDLEVLSEDSRQLASGLCRIARFLQELESLSPVTLQELR